MERSWQKEYELVIREEVGGDSSSEDEAEFLPPEEPSFKQTSKEFKQRSDRLKDVSSSKTKKDITDIILQMKESNCDLKGIVRKCCEILKQFDANSFFYYPVSKGIIIQYQA